MKIRCLVPKPCRQGPRDLTFVPVEESLLRDVLGSGGTSGKAGTPAAVIACTCGPRWGLAVPRVGGGMCGDQHQGAHKARTPTWRVDVDQGSTSRPRSSEALPAHWGPSLHGTSQCSEPPLASAQDHTVRIPKQMLWVPTTLIPWQGCIHRPSQCSQNDSLQF